MHLAGEAPCSREMSREQKLHLLNFCCKKHRCGASKKSGNLVCSWSASVIKSAVRISQLWGIIYKAQGEDNVKVCHFSISLSLASGNNLLLLMSEMVSKQITTLFDNPGCGRANKINWGTRSGSWASSYTAPL